MNIHLTEAKPITTTILLLNTAVPMLLGFAFAPVPDECGVPGPLDLEVDCESGGELVLEPREIRVELLSLKKGQFYILVLMLVDVELSCWAGLADVQHSAYQKLTNLSSSNWSTRKVLQPEEIHQRLGHQCWKLKRRAFEVPNSVLTRRPCFSSVQECMTKCKCDFNALRGLSPSVGVMSPGMLVTCKR
ncbi:hypothetical protein Acr_00g0071560 [Actinidia rufa]|uniref:Uncharacterized protein n=1 Tax=Actinidia rufa TaxID=165716 RepID=A0A7J0DRS4_9ERIC|nr:hypothetical protein Acr_00g0071560 [Actinidia rufa]